MPFKKGQSGNPKGGSRPKLPPELRQAAKENKEKLKRLLLSYFSMPPAELSAISADPAKSTIEIILAKNIIAHMAGATVPKELVEAAVGKLVDDPNEFQLSDDEMDLIREYRTAIVQAKLSRPQIGDQTSTGKSGTPTDKPEDRKP